MEQLAKSRFLKLYNHKTFRENGNEVVAIDYRRHNYCLSAGWSSLVARRAHNPKVAGSNPAPATTQIHTSQRLCAATCGLKPENSPHSFEY